jgi:hypothetical protein
VLARSSKPIRKYAFGCLVNLMEKQFKKLAKRFFKKTITFREHPTKGRRPNLKSMYEFTRLLKQKVVI